MSTIYGVRRAILQALYDYINPQSLDTISCHDKVILSEADPVILRRQWQALQDAGYLRSVPGYNGEYCSLMPAVRAKLEKGWAMNNDEFLFGPGALR